MVTYPAGHWVQGFRSWTAPGHFLQCPVTGFAGPNPECAFLRSACQQSFPAGAQSVSTVPNHVSRIVPKLKKERSEGYSGLYLGVGMLEIHEGT